MPGALTEHLRLLADDTRLRILHLLDTEPLTVAEIQEIIDVSQSSVSGHLAKLKRAGLVHDHAEGSANRYRLREDMPPQAAASWQAIQPISMTDAMIVDDRQRLEDLRRHRGLSWIERVAGTLHREYAPGRNYDTLFHGLALCLDLGVCVDVGAGDGALLEVLAPQCQELICADPAAAMVHAGQARCQQLGLRNVTFIETAGESLPLPDGHADFVLFMQSLQYIEQPAAAIAQAHRVLKPGGRLIIMTLAKHHFVEAERYGHRHRGFNETALREWLKAFAQVDITVLPPENRSPRFQSIIATGSKPDAVD